MITSQQFTDAATLLKCEEAAIKAVAEVESGGAGFTAVDGKYQPVILFEPHIFWKQLQAHNIEPVRSEICYEHWGEFPYPVGQKAQYDRLDRAARINRDSALESCSWGKFQIMGFHWKTCGCATLQEFINAMYKSEDEHLRLFCNFLKSTGLDKPLQRKDWIAFARGYNGAGFEKNNYHKKINTAYLKYAKK
jgi:hypothetical protein